MPERSDSILATLIGALVLMISLGRAGNPVGQTSLDISGWTFDGWRQDGRARFYKKDGLFGYIDGGAEIFFQYGFEELSVLRYNGDGGSGRTDEKSVTLEIYRMSSPADAFGMFSVKRDGGEITSSQVDAVHWLTETQANLAKGDFFISIQAEGCSANEVEALAAEVASRIQASREHPAQLSWLPADGIISRTERYIRGGLAAAEESPLLAPDFWGFQQATEAVSARYEPSRTKLVVIHLQGAAAGLKAKVKAVFVEYLEEVNEAGEFISGINAGGRHFVFREIGSWAFLVLGDTDGEAARLLINKAEKAARPKKNSSGGKNGQKSSKNQPGQSMFSRCPGYSLSCPRRLCAGAGNPPHNTGGFDARFYTPPLSGRTTNALRLKRQERDDHFSQGLRGGGRLVHDLQLQVR
jgi:hypothetical protein